MREISSLLFVSVVALACQSKKERGENALAAIASANPALVASAAPVVSAVPVEDKKVVRRPGQGEALVVTPERRSRIESKHPEASGFVTRDDLEGSLFKLELPRGKEDAAKKELDRLARGKWILVTGPITNPKPEGVELAVRYTPRDPADPMGLTSQWVNVTFSQIAGYDASQYRPGEQGAILAKYEGEGKASPAFDLVLRDEWYIDGK